MTTIRIACLHTAASNPAVFEAALRMAGSPPVELRHELRADLLAEAERAGGLTGTIRDATVAALDRLRAGVDAVLLTCSTLGPSVEAFAGSPTPVLRVDEALAREAVRGGGRVVALCAVETTLAPTLALFRRHAAGTAAEVEALLVPRAWAAFKAGDLAGYHALVAAAADRALQEGATRVALAQASMAGAARLVRSGPAPLTSPAAGLRAAVAAAMDLAAKRTAAGRTVDG